MSWQHHFDRANQSMGPVTVDKRKVGPIPPGFESRGLKINNLWGVYERQQGLDQIRIVELPHQYRVHVSNPISSGNKIVKPTAQPEQSNNESKRLAAVAIGALGALAIRKAFGDSRSSPKSDPNQHQRVFISHSWKYEDHYRELKDILDEANGFRYYDHSVSSDNPIDAQLPNHLRKKIRDQMQSTSVVLVLAGMYAAHSDWIKEEIEIANEMEKPIIGVIPNGNNRAPTVVQENAEELVEVDRTEILDAVKQNGS